MDTPTEDFILIDDFLKDKLDANAKEGVLKKLSSDDNFYQDFQLWTNLDDWLEELPAFEIRQALRMDEREIKKVPFYKKKYFTYLVACSFLFLIGVGWYFSQNQGLKELSGEVQYGVIISQENAGTGFGNSDSKDKIRFKIKQFSVEQSSQMDTTYTFTRNPFVLKFRMKNIEENFGKKMVVTYNYKTKKYEFSIGKMPYHLEETITWKKLEKLSR